MLRICVLIVIISMADSKNLGTAHMISYMLLDYAKTVILTNTIRFAFLFFAKIYKLIFYIK